MRLRLIGVWYFFLSLAWVTPVALAAPLNASAEANAHKAIALVREQRWSQAEDAAQRTREPALMTYVTWQRLKAQDGGSFSEITDFLREHPGWPQRPVLMKRAEEALTREAQPPGKVIEWFTQHPPETADGKRYFAEALIANNPGAQPDKQAVALLRSAWLSVDLSKEKQKDMLSRYDELLTQKDIVARIDALLWAERVTQAQPLMAMVDSGHRALFDARITLMRDGANIDGVMNRVPASLRDDPGLIYERLAWRQRKGLDAGVRELLSLAPKNIPHPEKWWPPRNKQIRELLDQGQYKAAYHMAATHRQTEGSTFLDGEWMSGWIALTFLHDASTAYKHFYKLYHAANTPVSRSRGAYWSGAAAEENGNYEIARDWYRIGEQFPYTFYGQLAVAKASENPQLILPEPPKISDQTFQKYLQRETSKTLLFLVQLDEIDQARSFLMNLIKEAEQTDERAMAARLGLQVKRPDFAVKAAKQAIQTGLMLTDTAYPMPKFSTSQPVEKALVLAIARQESEFRSDSVSSAGAMGLMQVLPETAKQVARRFGLHFNKQKLLQSESYNLEVGSAYLHQLLQRYDGSYPLAIAAYNAGPGRITQWIALHGDPRTNKTDAVTWVERIPYAETRNYVQRVLENLQVYRYLLKDSKPQPLMLTQDLHYGGAAPRLIASADTKPRKGKKRSELAAAPVAPPAPSADEQTGGVLSLTTPPEGKPDIQTYSGRQNFNVLPKPKSKPAPAAPGAARNLADMEPASNRSAPPIPAPKPKN